MLGMIERDRRDDGGERAVDDIGGVEPPAQPHFEQQHVGRMAREQDQPRRSRDLEHRYRRAGIDALALGQNIGELVVADQAALARRGEPKALVEPDPVRRRVDVDAQAARFQDRAQEGDGRALAVGAGDVDHRRQPLLRMAERVENVSHPIERKIDQLRMQRGEPRDDGINQGHKFFFAVPAEPCGWNSSSLACE